MQPPDQRPLLYTYRRCPYAMRARMALLWAGVGFCAHEIVLRDKPPGLLAASPKGTVPVLVLPSGQVLEESRDIVRWALTLPEAPAAAARAWELAQSPAHLDLLRTNDGAFKHHLDRYKYPERFGVAASAAGLEQQSAWRLEHRSAAVHCLLEPLEQRWLPAPFVGGATPCATDLALFPFVRQFAAVEPAWFAALPLPRVQAWLQHWLDSAWFQACMTKLPPDQPVVFGAQP